MSVAGGMYEKLMVGDQAEIVRDFQLPYQPGRAAVERLRGVVLAGAEGKEPLSGASVRGEAVPATVEGFLVTTNEAGRFSTPRPDRPLILYARDAAGTLAGLDMIGEDADEVTVRVGSAGSARGRVVDSKGMPRAGVKVQCSILHGSIDDPVPGEVPAQVLNEFVRTDEEGRFTVDGLVPGNGAFFIATNPGSLDAEQVNVDVEGVGPIELPDIVLDPREE